MTEHRALITAPPDGVMTNEVGAITGGLELVTRRADDGTLHLKVRYAGAAEWYTLRGRYRLHDDRDTSTVHNLLVAMLDRPYG